MRNRPAEATADGERLAEEAEPEVPPTGERASALVDASPGGAVIDRSGAYAVRQGGVLRVLVDGGAVFLGEDGIDVEDDAPDGAGKREW